MAIKIAGTTVIDDSRNITTDIGTIDGRDISVDGAKLDGISAGATGDQTKADIDALNIDADTLDGQHGDYFVNSTEVNTKSTEFPFKAIKLTGSGIGDSYDERVILIIPKVETNTSSHNKCVGKITASKIGGNVFDSFDISVQSVYNSVEANFISMGQRNSHKWVTCTYNGIVWLAIKPAYTANPYNNFWFQGQHEANGLDTNNDALKVISYYDTQNGGTVLNAEINNSIADWTGGSKAITFNGNNMFHAGNDGSGSGLDADLLDGQHGSYYTGYTDTAISNLVDSSPATLDTLNELAAALGDDPNFATTVATNIGTKVSKSGDTMTGALTVSTSGSGRNITLKDSDSAGTAATPWLQFRDSGNTDLGYVGHGSGSSHDIFLYTNNGNPVLAGNSSSVAKFYKGGTYYNIFHEGYHPNADKWTTARTLSLSGDASGSVSWDGSANASLSVTVANDSHTHDGRYYTETEADSRFVNASGDTLTGTLNYRMLQSQSTSNYDTAGDNSGFSVFYGTGSATNKPSGTDHAVATFSYSDAWQTQLAMDWRTNSAYLRTQENGTWKGWNRLFTDGYHPNADKWTTARTLSLSGDASGSVSWDGSANVTLSVAVADDSHSHSQVFIPDTRGAARAPSYYPDRYVSFDFQNNADTGAGGDSWNVLQTVSPWSTYNSTHRQQQIAFTGSGGIKFRYATSDSAWAGWQTIWTSGNDGSGSGLDADLLDGLQGSSYLRSDVNNTLNGVLTINTTNDNQIMLTSSNTWTGIGFDDSGGVNDYIWHSGSNGTFAIGGGGSNVAGKKLHVDGGMSVGVNADATATPTNGIYSEGEISVGGNTAWHAGNDGSGSGLDADLLDGYQLSTTRNAANTVPVRDASGYLQLGWINTTSGSTTNTITKIYGTYNGDNYIRYFTPATLISQQGIWTSANDGSGSGLDADLLDGNHASAFYLATNPSGYTTNTGTIVENGTTFQGTYPVYFRIGANNAYSHPNITFTGATSTLTVSGDISITGDLTAGGEVISLSDVNFKENITSIETSAAIDIVNSLRPVSYNMIGEDATNVKVGFIAQEVEKVLPEVVHDNNGVLGVSYGNMIAVLTSALQDALTRIEELENVISNK